MISLSTNTDLFNELRQEIAKKMGKTPNSKNDLELLRADIQEETSQTIGHNTLRRFFGKLEFCTPQTNTLNVLSKYVGYKSFIDFAKHFHKNDEWYTWKKMNTLENEHVLTVADTKWLNSIKLKRDYPLMISYLVKSFINAGQYENLHQLFSSDCLLGLKYENQMKIGNSIGVYFRSLSKEKHKQLYSCLRYYSFRNIALYLFIYYSSFAGYYMQFIERALRCSTDFEEQLFLKLIVNYKKYLTCKGTPADFSAEQVPPTIHPILLGRFYGYRICTADPTLEKTTAIEMMAAAKKTDQKISFFLEVIPALMLTGQLKLLEKIFREFYTDLFDLRYWSQNDEISLYLIGEAMILVSKKQYAKAKEVLHKINLLLLTDAYYAYAVLFFQIADYQTKLGLQPNDGTLIEIEREYEQMVAKTGFKRFSKTLLKKYFENS